MKKVLSIVLSLIIIVLSLSCVAIAAVTLPGDVNGDGKVAAADARMILQVVAELKEKSLIKNFDNADVDVDGVLRATDARKILQIIAELDNEPSETPVYPHESDVAAWAEVFNKETAKLSNSSYKWERTCNYVGNLKVTGVSAGLIQPTVDKFLGIGSTNGTNADAGKYGLVAMKLTADDIKTVRVTDDAATIVINNTVNPSADGKSSFAHVSNDFVTLDDVKKVVSESGVNADITKFEASYRDIEVTGKINADGKITSIIVAYKLDAVLNAKAYGLKPTGEGTVETVITYKF